MSSLGICLRGGDHKETLKWFNRAAEAEDPLAQLNLVAYTIMAMVSIKT